MNGRSAGPLLALDTATSLTTLALERPGGAPAVSGWPASQRHGEELLVGLDRLLRAERVEAGTIRAIVVGTGPGAFTGLRVGLATAKGLAHALAVPIVGVPTSTALLAAVSAGAPGAAGSSILLLPAGPRDRVIVDAAGPRLLPAGDSDESWPLDDLVAVDLDGRAPAAALARGATALAGLGAALLRLGAERLASGPPDDLARLVPEYVSLPRGVRRLDGAIEWSRDPR
ncbi:MAG: tRNA (adenosine(37)-N6)-threonylcarbamoyltransferase complex dimerization subunit type 1 TsaB [Candidatus Limnocylindrales bacterium]